MSIVQPSDVYGELCWKAELGIGSFLTFEIGEPHVSERHRCLPQICDRFGTEHRCVHIIGSWTFWVYQCAWSILRSGAAAGDSTQSREEMQACAAKLVGSEIQEIAWSPTENLWRVTMEFDWEIQLTPYEGDDSSSAEEANPLAILFGPGRSSASLMANGSIC